MRRLSVLVAALLALGIPLVPTARAGGSSLSGACPRNTVCDRALGVALNAPAGWIQLRPPKVPRHEISLVRPTQGPSYDMRLVIRSLGTTTDVNNRRAAAAAAQKLIQSERATRATRVPVRYGGAPGILLRGIPGAGPAIDIVLAHAGGLYLIIAPGGNLAPDQQAALASLRFIPRHGPFPSANPSAPTGARSTRPIPPTLRVAPNPVPLGQPITVALSGVQPGEQITFQAAPVSRSGFGGGLMGRYRAGRAGTIRFTYPPFRKQWEVGRWRITASHTGSQAVYVLIRVVAS